MANPTLEYLLYRVSFQCQKSPAFGAGGIGGGATGHLETMPASPLAVAYATRHGGDTEMATTPVSASVL
ncbi:hypothetical protein V5F77_25965 [Xanthobacter sp. DSM 24535]|uniref:hypothetical protein n=1 Tax=Roseixanthobacter psychrophilus TaxID=3119917 RepID=UPI00372BD1B7